MLLLQTDNHQSPFYFDLTVFISVQRHHCVDNISSHVDNTPPLSFSSLKMHQQLCSDRHLVSSAFKLMEGTIVFAQFDHRDVPL